MINPFPNVIYKQMNPIYKQGEDSDKRMLIIGVTPKPADDKIFDPPDSSINTFEDEDLVRMFLADDYNFNEMYYYQPYLINSLEKAEKIFGNSSHIYNMVEKLYKMIGPTKVYAMNIYLDNLNLDDESNDISRLMSTLEHVEFDYILLDSDIRIETHFSLFDEFTNLAHLKEGQGQLVHMISLSKVDSLNKDVVFDNVEKLKKIYRGQTHETGKYVTVVNNQLIEYEAHIYYAAFLLFQSDAESPVNKNLNNELKLTLNNELSLMDERQYNDNGVVFLKDSFHRGVIFANATAAVVGTESIHKSFPNFKIVSAFIRKLYSKFDAFIGKPMNMFMNFHLMNIIETTESDFIELKYVRGVDYEFTIDETIGVVFLDLYIVPIFTVDEIKVSARIEVTVL